jgi:SAM-dependent methyltransferase
MKTPDDYNVNNVYQYQTSEDVKNYYNDWAKDYDNYTKDVKYTLPHSVAKIFVELLSQFNTSQINNLKILDIGCGTGLLGSEIIEFKKNLHIDGVDISSSMLRITSIKTKDFIPIYKVMILDDLTNPKFINENYYDCFVSAGTFTLGHLYARDMVNLLKYLKPNGLATFSIKEDHFIQDKFEKIFSNLKKNNIVYNLNFFKVNSYDSDFKAKSIIVTFNKGDVI